MSVQYFDTVVDSNGSPVNGATVTIYENDAITLATIYEDTSEAVELSNPLTTGSDGAFSFAVPEGIYWVGVEADGYNDNEVLMTSIIVTDSGDQTLAEHLINYDLHLTSDQNAALDAANSPTALNPLATIADVDNFDVTVEHDFTANQTFTSLQLSGGTGTQGTVTWNSDEETLDVVQNGAVLQVGQELQVHCRNATGSLISDGTVVMATGTVGASGRITVAPAVLADPKFIIGVTTEDIGNGDDGKVTVLGKVRGIDTSSWNDGDVLYVDLSDGSLTSTKPTTGPILPIAFVVYAAGNGTLMVRYTPLPEVDPATQVEMEAGTETNIRYMSPANIKQAIDALTPDSTVLTQDELDAINGANTPSSSNVFATMTDIASAGGGDMLASVYDPQSIADDAFDRANHTGTQAISTITDLQTNLDEIPDPTGITDGYVWTADGADGAAWEAPTGGSGVDATGVTDGYVLTADGADGYGWEAPTVEGIINTDSYTGTDTSTSITADYNVGQILVFVGGVYISPAADSGVYYEAIDGSTITVYGTLAGDDITVQRFGSFVSADHYTKAESDAKYATQEEVDGVIKFHAIEQLVDEVLWSVTTTDSTGGGNSVSDYLDIAPTNSNTKLKVTAKAYVKVARDPNSNDIASTISLAYYNGTDYIVEDSTRIGIANWTPYGTTASFIYGTASLSFIFDQTQLRLDTGTWYFRLRAYNTYTDQTTEVTSIKIIAEEYEELS